MSLSLFAAVRYAGTPKEELASEPYEKKSMLEWVQNIKINEDGFDPTNVTIVEFTPKKRRREVKEHPEWLPENPYPEELFPMSIDDYVKAVPDGVLRTAVTGCIGRWAFDVAARMIVRQLKEFAEEKGIQDILFPLQSSKPKKEETK